MMAEWPQRAASANGVQPQGLGVSTAVPRASSTAKISLSPRRAALASGEIKQDVAQDMEVPHHGSIRVIMGQSAGMR